MDEQSFSPEKKEYYDSAAEIPLPVYDPWDQSNSYTPEAAQLSEEKVFEPLTTPVASEYVGDTADYIRSLHLLIELCRIYGEQVFLVKGPEFSYLLTSIAGNILSFGMQTKTAEQEFGRVSIASGTPDVYANVISRSAEGLANLALIPEFPVQDFVASLNKSNNFDDRYLDGEFKHNLLELLQDALYPTVRISLERPSLTEIQQDVQVASMLKIREAIALIDQHPSLPPRLYAISN